MEHHSASPNEAKKILICKQIPQKFARRQPLKTHFEQYGEVVKVLVNPEKRIANIEFASHEQAAHARSLGTRLSDGTEISIGWKQASLGRRESSASVESPTSPHAKASHVREVPQGLYDDLPPPSEWEESSSSRSLDVKPKKSLFGKPVSIVSDKSNVKPSGLFGKHIPSETSSAGQSSSTQTDPSSGSKPKVSFGKDAPQPLAGMKAGAKRKQTDPSLEVWDYEPAVARRGVVKGGIPKHSAVTEPATKRLVGKDAPVLKRPTIFAKKSGSAGIFKQEAESAGLFGKAAVTAKSTDVLAAPKMLFGKSALSELKSEQRAYKQKTVDQQLTPILAQQNPTVDDLPFRQRSSPAKPASSVVAAPKMFFGKPVANQRDEAPTFDTVGSIEISESPRRSQSPAPIRRAPLAAPDIKPDIGDAASEEFQWILPSSMKALRSRSQICSTISEKHALLEKRDKILRSGVTKQTNIRKARATLGCCPDMCPERERYIREERRRVHVYEMVPGTEANPVIDHNRAVKEYSRSSADQEEPLQLELRPAAVLQTTMTYLCMNIMDLGDDSSWGDWYDFLWNRTRAIRKDITQQHLCDPDAVSLVEKCARFHIYCAERLCEQGPMVFDEKINNENLTKCLQTLKEMYEDLAAKTEVEASGDDQDESDGYVAGCDFEPEFRAYMVLMNMNDGDTLRKVQQLRSDLRNTDEMQFALEAYKALSERNYIRFFKLVGEADILQASILHRYFNQIRHIALMVVLRSHFDKKKSALSITLGEMTRLLHFEDLSECKQFLEACGLDPPEDADQPATKTAILQSIDNISLSPRRSRIVEDKLHTTAGEIVYGEPLPENWVLPPSTSSFDEQGMFVGIVKPPEVGDDEGIDQGESGPNLRQASSLFGKATQQQPQFTLPDFKSIPNEVVKDITKELINGELHSMIGSVARELQQELDAKRELIALIARRILDETISGELSRLCNNIIVQEKEEAEMREKAYEDKLKADIVQNQTDQILACIVKSLSGEISQEVINEEQAAKHAAAVIHNSKHVETIMIDEVVDRLAAEVAVEVFHSDVTLRLEELEEHTIKLYRFKSSQIWNVWKRRYSEREARREAIREFPAGPIFNKKRPEVRFVNGQLHLSKRSRINIPDPDQMITELSLGKYSASLLEKRQEALARARTRIDYHDIFSSIQSKTDDMKLCVLVERSDKLSNWVCTKLSASENGYFINSKDGRMRLVVRQGHIGDTVSTIGATALLYVLPSLNPNRQKTTQDYLSDFISSANNLNGASDPRVPLLVISPDRHLNECAGLEALKIFSERNAVRLTDVRVLRLLDYPDLSQKYSLSMSTGDNAIIDFIYCLFDLFLYDTFHSSSRFLKHTLPANLVWLLSSQSPPPSLSVCSLHEIVNMHITENYHCVIQAHLTSQRNLNKIHQPPHVYITHYNRCITSLATSLSDGGLEKYSWPIPELQHSKYGGESLLLDWNSNEVLSKLRDDVRSLALPNFLSSEPEAVQLDPESQWEIVYKDVYEYLQQVLAKFPSETNSHVISRIEKLLSRSESRFRAALLRRYPLSPNPTLCFPLYTIAPWADIISLAVEHIMYNLPQAFHANTAYDENMFESVDLQFTEDDGMTYSATLDTVQQFIMDSQPEKSINIMMEDDWFNDSISLLAQHEKDQSQNFIAMLEKCVNNSAGDQSWENYNNLNEEDGGDKSFQEELADELNRSLQFERLLQDSLNSEC